MTAHRAASVPRIQVIHRQTRDSLAGIARLRRAGYRVVAGPLTPALLRALRDDPPAAVVIDLARAPMLGRDVGLAVRKYRATRRVPVVFVGGEPDKVARVRRSLPDAAYTTWSGLGPSLRRAIARPPARPVVPESLLAGYSGTPLPRKLGIKEGMVVALVDAPPGFERILSGLPEGAVLRRGARPGCGLALWFPRSARDLERRLARLASLAAAGGMWIAWPKRSSGRASDLSQAVVRKVGLAAGLVDHKICAIDATWTGLKFAVRRRAAGARARKR